MARGKQKMALIQDKVQRKACYKKRKKGLLKKAQELSIRCGVDTCVIVYHPYNGEPETWPESYDEVMKLISRFENQSVMDKSRKMLNQEGFVKETIRKIEEQLKKMQNENRQKEIKYLVSQHMKCHLSNLNDLWKVATEQVEQINQRLQIIEKGSTTHNPPEPLPPPLPTLPAPPPSVPLAAAQQITATITEGYSYGSEGSIYSECENVYIDAIWAKVQASGISDFDDKDDAFFLNLLNNEGAGPSFSKS